ncbi:MAG: hypothetical protein AAF569_03150 [Pseudomonadota bacterium]
MYKPIAVTRIISVLWFMWSLPHIIPGIMMMQNALSGDISSIQFLFPETDSSALKRDYPLEVDAILVTFGQHGFNLFWFGIVALISAVWIWVWQSRAAIILASVVIGFADVGALFATFMIGRIDIFGILIFTGTLLGIILSVSHLKKTVQKR